jgi:vacuolar protein sorting-associated protein 45
MLTEKCNASPPVLLILSQRIRALLASDKVRQVDLLRMVMLYALRYESHSNNDLSGLVEALKRRGVAEEFRAVLFFLFL